MIEHVNKIFVFGDSHSGAFLLFSEELPFKVSTVRRAIGAHLYPFIPIHFSGATAYGLLNPDSSSKSYGMWEENLKNVNKERDLILLWFGEIDCRYHIKDNQMIDDTINNYITKLKELREQGYSFIVLTIPPPNKDKGSTPIEDRPKIYKEYNDRLVKACIKEGIYFIDMYYHGVDGETGFMKLDMMRDAVHYKPEAIYEYVIGCLSNICNLKLKFYG